MIELMKSPEVLRLHPYHRLIYDIHLSIMVTSNKINEINTYLYHSSAAIQLFENVIEIGHPDLAYLYNGYGLTLCKYLLENEMVKDEVKEKAKQVYFIIIYIFNRL